MKPELAHQLLKSILPDPPWDEEKLDRLFRDLGVLAEYKYNQYEMFEPGRLFFENLYLWLKDFTEAERTTALNFVREKLLFISRDEFQQLAEILYRDQIHERQLDYVHSQTGVARHRIRSLSEHPLLREVKQASLYVALSDGARIDYFRRQNLEINNEQVLTSYQPNEEKIQDLLGALAKRVGRKARFRCLFLLDDFCGSGKTLLREVVRLELADALPDLTIPPRLAAVLRYKGEQEKKKLELAYQEELSDSLESDLRALHPSEIWGDTITELLQKNRAQETSLAGSLMRLYDSGLFEALEGDCLTYLCPLLSTKFALDRLNKLIPRLPAPLNRLELVPGTIIPDGIRIKPVETGVPAPDPMAILCDRYYQDDLGDEHTGAVKYGYDECGLPLVLHHNTPNNSIYLLWLRKLNNPLFARLERHGRERQ